MRTIVAAVLAVVVLVSAIQLGGLAPLRHQMGSALTTTWEGEVNEKFRAQVEEDLEDAYQGGYRLVVKLNSPGGSALDMFEILRQMELYKKRGVVIEIHGTSKVISAATLIISHGTFGKRYISKETLFLVHAMQIAGKCMDHTMIPQAGEKRIVMTFFGPMEIEISKEDAGILRNLIERFVIVLGRYTYMRDGVLCSDPVVGGPELAVQHGFADFIEE